MKYNIPIVNINVSIEDTIYRIDRSKYSIAIIIDNKGAYVSHISIYKIRRLLLSGTDCSDLVSSVIPDSEISLKEIEINRKDILKSVLKEMDFQGIEFCPIINDDNKIIDVYRRNEISNMIMKKSQENNGELKNGYVKNVLIVGGAGYLGSVLVRELLGRGYFVRVLDNFIYGKKSTYDIRNNPSLNILEGDFRNIETIVSSLRDIDAVILLAAIVGDPASKARPTQTIETNYLAAQALASACKSQQINRFIYASTCSVYGKGNDILDENSPLNPVSLYARTKIASEQCIISMANHSFAPTVLRMGTLYGYSPRMRFDLVVNTMTLKSFLENRIQVFGGKQWRPLLHVKDAATAYIKCLESPIDLTGNQIFNVGSEKQNYKIIEIAELIKQAFKKVKVTVEKSNIDDRDYRVSFDKIKNMINYKPEYNILNAVKEIYKNLKNGVNKNPLAKIYYNHYFDSTEE